MFAFMVYGLIILIIGIFIGAYVHTKLLKDIIRDTIIDKFKGKTKEEIDMIIVKLEHYKKYKKTI